ncbi:hypothetical protein [Microbacterium oleivorans]|nr:hypothetical protein [Microbacterium oleivorans]
MTIEGRRYVDEVVRVVDLFTTEDFLTGYSFTNCLMVGPAIMIISASQVTNCVFEGERAGLGWMIPREADLIFGVVGFDQSVFDRCRFQRIGFAGDARHLDQLLGLGAS